METLGYKEQLRFHKYKIGFLASGNGSAMGAILEAIEQDQLWSEAKVLITNRSKSPARDVAKRYGMHSYHVSGLTNPDDEFETIAKIFNLHCVDPIICSGYEKVARQPLLDAFPHKILNIHPSIEERYMGPGWMDMTVHEAVISDKRPLSGYIIHTLSQNENEVDKGTTRVTGIVRVTQWDDAFSLKRRVQHEEKRGIVSLLDDMSLPTIGHSIKMP